MLNKYFEHIVCISLVKRKDRRSFFDRQAKGIGFTFEYFDAIAPELGNGLLTKERLGCLRSHREVLIKARMKGFKNVLILEDDCQFRNESGQLFLLGMNNLPDYDLLYLGGSLWNTKGTIKRFDDNFNIGSGILTTHSYCVPEKNFTKIIDLLEAENKPVDVKLSEFQTTNKTLIFKKNITRQLDGYSDIEKRSKTSWLFDN